MFVQYTDMYIVLFIKPERFLRTLFSRSVNSDSGRDENGAAVRRGGVLEPNVFRAGQVHLVQVVLIDVQGLAQL